jgi:partitioning defective protein 6
LDAEFRRFAVDRHSVPKFDDFRKIVETLHCLGELPFTLSYTDPKDGDLLPINNDDNYAKAIQNAKPLLRLIIQRKGVLKSPPLRDRNVLLIHREWVCDLFVLKYLQVTAWKS